MADGEKMLGIDVLRKAVTIFSWCGETFNQRYTADALLRIAEAHMKSEWDILPDEWSARQIDEAIVSGKPPQWREGRGGYIPVYEG